MRLEDVDVFEGDGDGLLELLLSVEGPELAQRPLEGLPHGTQLLGSPKLHFPVQTVEKLDLVLTDHLRLLARLHSQSPEWDPPRIARRNLVPHQERDHRAEVFLVNLERFEERVLGRRRPPLQRFDPAPPGQ